MFRDKRIRRPLSCASKRPGFKMSLRPAAPQGPTDNVTASLLMLAAVVMFTVETVAIRWLGSQANVWQAVLFRGFGQVVVVIGWMIRRGALPDMRSNHPWLHVIRGLASIFGWWLYYWTFQRLGVALATLLSFASSLFVVMLAGPVLGERVRGATWAATVAGFAGIAIASGVGTVSFDIGVLIGLAAAAFSATIVFVTRALAQTEDTLTIMIYIGLFVMAAAVPMAWRDWQPLSMMAGTVLLASGILGAFGMVLMIEAYGKGEAAVLAPIPYVRIALAMVLGYVLFAEVPTLNMVVGSLVVVLSALWSMRHEHQRQKRL